MGSIVTQAFRPVLFAAGQKKTGLKACVTLVLRRVVPATSPHGVIRSVGSYPNRAIRSVVRGVGRIIADKVLLPQFGGDFLGHTIDLVDAAARVGADLPGASAGHLAQRV